MKVDEVEFINQLIFADRFSVFQPLVISDSAGNLVDVVFFGYTDLGVGIGFNADWILWESPASINGPMSSSFFLEVSIFSILLTLVKSRMRHPRVKLGSYYRSPEIPSRVLAIGAFILVGFTSVNFYL
ncbi:MAG: hypothetical protein OET63_20315 [Desulfobacterales bacterium]|nr:hypothetical protein [Desulfobacterales bacterium]